MFRKLTVLALLGGAVAYLLKNRGGGGQESAMPSTSQAQPQTTPDPTDLAEVRPAQTQDTVETPAIGVDGEESVIPDVSADDPLVREQEAAAAEDAGSIGGDADTVTADVDPEMRPVVEGSGDAEETFERTEDQGR
jgi:hypothetical protein